MNKKEAISHLLYGGLGHINYPVGRFNDIMYYNVSWISCDAFPNDFDFTVALPATDLEIMDKGIIHFIDNSRDIFDNHLRGLIEYILLQPVDIRKQLEKEIVDNINELHYNNNY